MYIQSVGGGETRPARSLMVGDKFLQNVGFAMDGTSGHPLEQDGYYVMLWTTVTVLRDQEPATDIFNQQLFKFWCRREDTGAEGYMTFGPAGVVLHQFGRE